MASLSTDIKGRRRIQFFDGNGERRSVRLAKITAKSAREILTKVEALNAAKIANISIDRQTAEWLGDTEPTLYDKLAAVDLVPERVGREQATLGAFIDGYIKLRTDVKPRTVISLKQARRRLVDFFGAAKPLRSVTQGDADEWRLWLASDQKRPNGTIRKKLADNTGRRTSAMAKQLFGFAVRKKLIAENPFTHLKSVIQRNASRYRYISRDEADKVLAVCPDTQWRVLFVLSRYGGLRCPSEHLGLTWGDVDWDGGKLRVASPKTEHHEGGESRLVPLFPEVRAELQKLWDEVEAELSACPKPSEEPIITRYRDASQNLRTTFQKIIRRAGLEPWEKLFQNLRSTRETELAQTYPIHVVCAWIGNSAAVAAKHYLQVTDADYEIASATVVQNPAQYASITVSTKRKSKTEKSKTPVTYSPLPLFTTDVVGPPGLEPGTKGL